MLFNFLKDPHNLEEEEPPKFLLPNLSLGLDSQCYYLQEVSIDIVDMKLIVALEMKLVADGCCRYGADGCCIRPLYDNSHITIHLPCPSFVPML